MVKVFIILASAILASIYKHKETYTLVVCLSTNGQRSLNYTIVKRLILTSYTQATKMKSSF